MSELGVIPDVDIEFGRGLNVLYGPNELGKSTLSDAIRLGLLLPHTSTHIEDYVPWAGGREPQVEITFETEPQRIWRVRKEFRKGGTALLEESKNGVDFDEVARARKVDGMLRELMRWGLPEPGGSGGAKGLPTSFLSTVLLSTQSDVAAVLNQSLQNDPTITGREQVAAALQAVAQDPLFASLLRATQARRDEAFTDKGAKKTAKGSVFKAAADRVTRARDEKEQLQQAVDESDSVETQLHGLTTQKGQYMEAVAAAVDRVTILERLAREAADIVAAAELVGRARQEVLRIEGIGDDVAGGERTERELARGLLAAGQAVELAQMQNAAADSAVKSAEDGARATGSDPTAAATVARQRLQIQGAVADQASGVAERQIEAATAARKLMDAVATAEQENRARQAEADGAGLALADTAAQEHSADEQRRGVDLLARAQDASTATERAAVAKADVDKDVVLRARREAEAAELESLSVQRAAIAVPTPDNIGSMRRLATDLAGARGALDVGLVVTVTPNRPLDVRVTKDGTASGAVLIDKALDVGAKAEVDIEIGDVGTVRVRGGRREAQQMAKALEARWNREVLPHLAAANVADLDGLEVKATEAQRLDTSVKEKAAELQSLHREIDSLAGSAQTLREALDRRAACHNMLGDVPLETFASDLATLGADPTGVLRGRQERSSTRLDAARAAAGQARTAHALAEDRVRTSGSALREAVAARDAALVAFPAGAEATLSAARSAIAAAAVEQQAVAAERTSLEGGIAAEKERVEVLVREARAAGELARAGLDAAEAVRVKAMTDHASQVGRLEQLRQLRDAEDLDAASRTLQRSTERHAALPVPERNVSEAEHNGARTDKATAEADLMAVEREVQRRQGALEQVGGAVARERLREAVEAFESAERQEREIEADYDAWFLLLEQMKQADAAQASNLGQALSPAIAKLFEALTARRYENIQLTDQLGTKGLVVAGAVRPMERISIGTRDQLSTLFRLALAEYLSTTVVLDDQLVQSDETRMEWFRTLLAEKAHSFQIIVFTCRPGDYLAATAIVPEGTAALADTDNGFTRAVDLGRAVRGRKPEDPRAG